MGYRKGRQTQAKEWSPWDKAFWASLVTLGVTIAVAGFNMYVTGITNPLEDQGGIVGGIMKIDKVFSVASFFATIVTGIFKR
jgi:hypothetical protein